MLQFDIYTLCKLKWEVVNLHDDATKGVNLGSAGEMNGTSCWSVINHLWLTHSAGRLQFCCMRARDLKVHDNGLPEPRWALFWERSNALLLYSTETDVHAHTRTCMIFFPQLYPAISPYMAALLVTMLYCYASPLSTCEAYISKSLTKVCASECMCVCVCHYQGGAILTGPHNCKGLFKPKFSG